MYKNTLLHIMAVAALTLSSSAVTYAMDDTPENRAKLARQFHRVNPPTQIVDNALEKIASGIRDEKERAQYIKSMQIFIDIEGVEKASLSALEENFTVEELEFLVNMYGSELGKRTLGKVPAYQQKVTPEITKALDEALLKMKTGGGSDLKR